MNTETTSDPKKYGKFHALNVFLGDKISYFFPHLSLTHICENYSVGVGGGRVFYEESVVGKVWWKSWEGYAMSHSQRQPNK